MLSIDFELGNFGQISFRRFKFGGLHKKHAVAHREREREKEREREEKRKLGRG
jgi:hypothetical protein